jgi:kinesin family protein 5
LPGIYLCLGGRNAYCTDKWDQGGAVLDSAGEKLRQVLKDLEGANDQTRSELSAQTKDLIRSSLAENQEAIRDLQERLRLSQEDADMQAKRKAEVEKLLGKRNAAYEELLGESVVGLWRCASELGTDESAEKTASSQSEAIDIRVRPVARSSCRNAA